MINGMRVFKIRVGIILLTILLLAGGAGAVPVEEWNKTFAKSYDNTVSFIQQTSDGGYIFVGSITNRSDPVNHHKYAWAVKIDSNGNEQWNRTFVGEVSKYSATISEPGSGERTISGEQSEAYANAVQHISGGGYTIIGSYVIGGGSGKVIWVINLDANGNERWNKTLGGIGYAYSFEQTSDSGYIIAGSKTGDSIGIAAWLIKTDANGNEQWNKTFRGKSNFHLVQQTPDGGYILAGGNQAYSESGPVNEGWVIKTDAYGNEQWNKTLTYSPGFINQTLDGGYILANSTGWYKVDANGNEQWNRKFGITEKDTALSYKQTSDSGFILAGQTSLLSNGYMQYTDTWLSKIDSNGKEQWNLTLGVPGSSIVSVKQTPDGGYMLAGTRFSSTGTGFNTWLIKLSEEPVETTKVPTASPTGKPEISPTKKVAGFEVVLAIAMLLVIYLRGRKTK